MRIPAASPCRRVAVWAGEGVAKGKRACLPGRVADCCVVEASSGGMRLCQEQRALAASHRAPDERRGAPPMPMGEARLVSTAVQRARAAGSGETSFEWPQGQQAGDPARWTDLPRGLSANLSPSSGGVLAQAPCASSRRRGGDADGTDTGALNLLPGHARRPPWSSLAAQHPRHDALCLLKDGLPYHDDCPLSFVPLCRRI
jgi:hypothetical protein